MFPRSGNWGWWGVARLAEAAPPSNEMSKTAPAPQTPLHDLWAKVAPSAAGQRPHQHKQLAQPFTTNHQPPTTNHSPLTTNH